MEREGGEGGEREMGLGSKGAWVGSEEIVKQKKEKQGNEQRQSVRRPPEKV